MCTAQQPKPVPIPPARAQARAPQRVIPPNPLNGGAQSTRPTVVNPTGVVQSAPTAKLGGSVVLGGGTSRGGPGNAR